jgi:prevent-host-death family protein
MSAHSDRSSSLSSLLNEEVNRNLAHELRGARYHGVTFEQAMQFFLTDGVLPRSRAPVAAFLALEDWLRGQKAEEVATCSASELKNKTGEILEKVLRGHTVRILKHGREIARLVPSG